MERMRLKSTAGSVKDRFPSFWYRRIASRRILAWTDHDDIAGTKKLLAAIVRPRRAAAA